MKVVVSAQAERDLDSIAGWIAADNPRRALLFVRELRQACEGLGKNPERFAVALASDGRHVRRRVLGNYLIFFNVDRVSDTVRVIRVLHAARDYPRLFEAPSSEYGEAGP